MDIEVKPDNWMLTNRIGYNKYIYNTFHPKNYENNSINNDVSKKSGCECDKGTCDLHIKSVSLFPQQRIIKDYMQFDSPYRGILLYHELGSGKSAASIAAAEGYINRKKIVIMTPASLSQNYENELMKISKTGLNLKKSWTLLKVEKSNKEMMKTLNKYAITDKIIKKDGLVWVPLYNKDINGAEIIVERTKYSKIPSNYKDIVDQTIVHIIRNRYTFINYNGLTAKMIKELGASPFDDTFVIIDEIHNFISRIVNGSRLARTIYNHMMNANNIKIVLLSGTPIINQPYEIATLINLIRGPMITYKIPIANGQANKMNLINTLESSKHYNYIDEIYHDDKNVNIILFPKNFVRKDKDSSVIIKKDWGIDDTKIIREIISKINNQDVLSSSIKSIKLANNKKPYLIVTNGIAGSMKLKLADKIISDLKLNTDNVKINIDDLVVHNDEYKRRVLDIINRVNKECNNDKDCILEKYENPSEKLLEDFKNAYYDVRNGKKNIQCTPEFKKSCDLLLESNLENALKENKNIIFETQGLQPPKWLLSHKYLTDRYNVIYGYSFLNVDNIISIIKKRAKARIFKFQNNQKMDAPRFPSIDKKEITKNIKQIINVLKELRSNCMNEDEIMISNCGNKKIDKLLIYNPDNNFNFNLVYDNNNDISDSDFEALIDNIINEKVADNINGITLNTKYQVEKNYALPNKKEDFDRLFINDSEPENIKIKNEDLFKRRILGTLSYYKTTGSEFFPNVLPTNYKYLNMTNHQLNKYVEVRRKEMDMDDRKKKFGNKGNADVNSVYRAFSRMVCNFVFPDNIKRAFPQDIRLIMKKELAKNVEDDDSSEESVDKKDINKAVATQYEKQLETAMNELSKSDAINVDKLKELYSPKFAEMLKDMNESPGSVLVYSQFRMVEGLGILKEVMNRNGYVEINVTKSEEFGYIIEDVDVFDEKYDNKRYVVFNSDRTKTNILMNLFNGDFSLLPDNIKIQIDGLENIDQRYGKLVKTMMITQSGAEGISLKNVRRVLITEYFWNSVRINQVIGRAVRTCSHMSLPKEHQNVGVYMYIMKLTKEQLANNPTLRKKDNELTTDEHILLLAQKKEGLINGFLNMLKSSSIDCVIHSNKNKPLANGYKCYNWPINVNDNKLSYTENIGSDGKIQQHQKYQKLIKNKGKVVSKNGIKYVLLGDKLYDYNSYVNAGLLYRANI